MNAIPTAQFRSIMLRLQGDYLEQVKGYLENCRRMKALVRDDALPDPDLRALYGLSHDFAGSGATFGFPEISRAARVLYLAIKAVLDNSDAAHKAHTQALLHPIEDFEAALISALEKTPEEASAGLVLPETPELVGEEASSDIYFLSEHAEREDAYMASLAGQIRHFGYNVIVRPTPETAGKKGVPKAFIAFSSLSAGETERLRGLCAAAARDCGVPVPLIAVAEQGEFDTRLAAARMGAQGFFERGTDALTVIDRIEQLSIKMSEPPRHNVMIVDDDRMLTEFYSKSLAQAGMSVITVTNPRDALGALGSQQVDLILIDFSMPGCNGQELAAVIRQHARYVSLPIIFISSYEDLQRALVDTGLGIDDFLVKPFTPDRLFSVVRSRAQRATELKSLMMRDSFTGLLNHAHFNEALGNELSRVRRGLREASYAMLDLDHFKAINDTYGHAAGDQVIKSMSLMLQQSLRRSDIVGRCGGEEFGIILPECPLEKALATLEKIRATFAGAEFVFNDRKVSVTFSAGLIRVDADHDLDHLIKCADTALYAAKKEGRNRISVVEG